MKFILLITFFSSIIVVAQDKASFEASLNFGITSFKTDYFEKGGFVNDLSGNSGFAFTTSAYFNIFNNSRLETSNWTNNHLKLKGEFSYQKANLDHLGSDVDNIPKLLNMHGTASLMNLGIVLEYYPLTIPDFITTTKRLSPFASLGVLAGYNNPTVKLDSGDWENNQSLLIDAYKGDAIDVNSKLIASLLFSGGLRYFVNDVSAIIFDMRWQYFNTDYIDALNPSTSSNIHKDWLYNINIGYSFTLGKETKGSTWSK